VVSHLAHFSSWRTSSENGWLRTSWRLHREEGKKRKPFYGSGVESSMSDSSDTRDELKGSTSIDKVELSVCDSFFCSKKPSAVAYNALMVAMDSLSVPSKTKQLFGEINGINVKLSTECSRRLQDIYNLAAAATTQIKVTGLSPPTV
jgi:hypothetical protein